MAIREFRLPDPGEGLVEADIVTWRVAVGDTVRPNDIVVEVETSKSLVELPSPYAGTVTRAAGRRGRHGRRRRADHRHRRRGRRSGGAGAARRTTWCPTCPRPAGRRDRRRRPGTAEWAGGRSWSATGRRPPRPSGGRASRPRRRSPDGAGARPDRGDLRHRRPGLPADRSSGAVAALGRRVLRRAAADSGLAPVSGATAAPEPRRCLGGRSAVLAKPPVRKLAKDLGVDLSELTGTGPGGVITRDDVLASQRKLGGAEPVDALAVDQAASFDGRRTDSAFRSRAYARPRPRRWWQSAFTAPHVSEWLTCDVIGHRGPARAARARREFADIGSHRC